MRIDLHAHSSRSDGTDTPTPLIAAARAAHLDVVALTDHDNVDGWEEAAAALPAGMTLIGGAEFSTNLPGTDGHGVGVHLLGYLFDPAGPAIVAEQQSMVSARANRGDDIVVLMTADGIPIDIIGVREIAAGAPVGRPHIGHRCHPGPLRPISARIDWSPPTPTWPWILTAGSSPAAPLRWPSA